MQLFKKYIYIALYSIYYTFNGLTFAFLRQKTGLFGDVIYAIS